jgi:aquaporin Z
MGRKLAAELLGTGLLVFFGVGVATPMFGFGFDGGSVAAGVVATALAFGLALTVAHLVGIPITGTSVNPARSLGPALIVGGTALSQVWLFIVAPLVGGAVAAGLHYLVFPKAAEPPAAPPVSQ